MTIRITHQPGADELAEIEAGLRAYNSQFMAIGELKSIGAFIEDASGKKLAGLTGSTAGNWLRINMLWVSEALRGQGTGTALMQAVEEEARRRGCLYAQVDTASFQARPFYEKQGYVVRLVLDNYPRVHQRFYLTKTL
ncbi:N-acetyltransferase [Erwinia sp. 198]|uniref:GNAT family N-acetyltransferase n=1 Tax=Erwinia sp. 198 TaxID=2022746 RepID=UPI001F3AD47E|nr:GNAT family N-acetyltransferase [Erwinia sp. 198]